MKKAFITGITGQDGYYLSKLLLEKGYQVHGTIRRSSTFNTSRIESLMSKYSEDKLINLYYSDLLDPSSLNGLIQSIQPNEVYNLAAQSHVAVSFKNPQFSISTSTAGPVSLLDSIKNSNSNIKYYQASSSEMYGGGTEEFLNENSLFDPKSPYAAGKVFAHNMTKIYRDSYNLFCVNGILFNHESPFRGETFVTRKITRALGRIYHGIQNKLYLGNLDAVRDWGFAGDYVEAMWLMMQQDTPEDYVISTGKTWSIKELCNAAFSAAGIDNWEDKIVTNPAFVRPAELYYLKGDSTKAKEKLGWEPSVSFEELITMMVQADLERYS